MSKFYDGYSRIQINPRNLHDLYFLIASFKSENFNESYSAIRQA